MKLDKRITLLLSATSLALTLNACAVGQDYVPPQLEPYVGELFETPSERLVNAEPVAAWWRQWNDPLLADLVDDALQYNHDVRIALANLEQARAVVDESFLTGFPIVTANGSATRQKFSEDQAFGPGLGDPVSSFGGGFDARWEMDLFGRYRNRVDGFEALAAVRQAELTGAYISVAAEVARTYMQLRGAQLQLMVTEQNIAKQQRTFELTKMLSDVGEGDEFDTARSRARMELTKASLPPLLDVEHKAISRLSVLTGKIPNALQEQLSATQDLPQLPEQVALGNPLQLLRSRPDIAAAERQFAASVAQYNLDYIDLFPRITMLGSVGFESTSFSSFGNSGTERWSFGPSISWAAFDIGRVLERINASDAATRAQFAGFEKTVLLALEETDNALVNLRQLEDRRASLREAAEASSKAADFANQRFDAGVDDLLDVLTAEQTMLDAQSRLAQAETDLAIGVVTVYKVLGWHNPPAPETEPGA